MEKAPWEVDDLAVQEKAPWEVDDTVVATPAAPAPAKTPRVSAAPVSAPANPPKQQTPKQPAKQAPAPVQEAKTPWKEDDTIVSTPAETRRDFSTRFGDAWKAGIQSDNFIGRAALYLADKANINKDAIRRAFPNQSEEFYEVTHRSLLEQAQRKIREDYTAKQAADPAWRPDESWIRNLASGRIFADILGAVPAEAGPEMLLNPGKTVFGRIAAQMGLSGAADVGYQNIAMEQGVRDEYDINQTALATGMGGLFQGGLEGLRGVVKGVDLLRGSDNPSNPLEIKNPKRRLYPEEEAEYLELLKTGSTDDVVNYVTGKGMNVNRADVDRFIQNRDKPGAQQAQVIYEDQRQKLLTPNQPAQRAAGKFTPQTKAVPSLEYQKFTKQDTETRVAQITDGWENKPEFEIVDTVNEIADPSIRRAIKAEAGKGNQSKIMGFLGEDGKVRIIAKNIRSEDELSAVLFHETLGHAGLRARFQDGLDDVLMSFYDNGSGNFRSVVDAWLEKNPNAYKGDPNRVARAAEEVLAGMSQGGKIEPGLYRQIVEWLKRFAREHGMNLKYSDEEIRTILGLAHADITGKGRSEGFKGGNRLIRLPEDVTVWHGTPADDFNNKTSEDPYGSFDDNYMGKGEGVQAYSWGHYMAQDRSIAEGRYRDGLSKQAGKTKNSLKYDGKLFDEWIEQNEPTIEIRNTDIPPIGKNTLPGRKAAALAGRPLFRKEKFFTQGQKDKVWRLLRSPEPELDREIWIENLQEKIKRHELSINRMLQDTAGFGPKEAKEMSDFWQQEIDIEKATIKWLKSLDFSKVEQKRPGSTFEITLPKDSLWLDWDFQPDDETVEAFKRAGFKVPELDKEALALIDNQLAAIIQRQTDLLEQNPSLYDDLDKWGFKDDYDVIDLTKGANAAINDSPKTSSEVIKEYSSLMDRYSYIQAERTKLIEDSMLSGEDMYRRFAMQLHQEKDAKVKEAKANFDSLQTPEAKEKWAQAFDERTQFNGEKEVSKRLAREGVAGTRFADGNSRWKIADGDPTATFNYVLYEPKDKQARIVNKFMRQQDEEGSRIGNINTNNIRTVGDIDNILDLLAEQNQNVSKSVEEIDYEARQLGFTPSKVAKQPGVGNLAARITAARQVMVDLLDQVAKLDDDPRSSNAAYVKRMQLYSKLAAVHAKVSGDVNELGRAMRSLQILSESQRSADEIARRMKDGGSDIFKDPELFAKFDQDIRMMMQQGNIRGAIRKTKDSFKPKAEDYIFAAWYNFLLSSPATHFVNMAGTGLNFVNDLLVKGLAATMGQAKRYSIKTVRTPDGYIKGWNISRNADRVMGREVAARVWGAVKALQTASTYRKTVEAYKRGSSESFDNTKAENQNIVVPGQASYVLESPVRSLAAEDEWFRNVIQLSNIYGMAVRKAGKEGLKGQAFRDRVNDLIANPTRDMIDDSKEFSKVLQFQDEMSGIGKMVNNLRKTNPNDDPITRIAKGGMRLIVPFVQTPDALIRTAVRNMGPFAALEREFWKGLKKGGPEEDMVKARMLLSSALMTFFAVQVANGGIAGNGPTDYKKREEWLLTHQPNSIKINGKWYSIAGLDPFVTPILAIATAYERAEAGEDTDEGYFSKAADVTLGLASALADTAYTQNLVEGLSMFDNSDERAEDKFKQWAAGIAASATVPAILRQYAQNYGDQNEYVTKGDGSLEDRVAGRITASVKGTAVEETLKDFGVDTNLPQKYDALGRPKVRGETFGPDMLTRIRTKPEETDEAVLELTRLGKAMSGALITEPSKIVGGRRLTEAEFEEYKRVSGTYILEKTREVMQTEKWQKASDIERRKMVVKIKNKQRENARKQLGLGKED